MIVRAIDGTGDWTFGKGRNNYVSRNDAISQDIKTRLQSFLGDCFFAISDGLDWFNLLGTKDQLSLQFAIRAVILNTVGVTGVKQVQALLNPSTRGLTINYSADTVYTGTTEFGPAASSVTLLTTEDGFILTTEDGAHIAAG